MSEPEKLCKDCKYCMEVAEGQSVRGCRHPKVKWYGGCPPSVELKRKPRHLCGPSGKLWELLTHTPLTRIDHANS